MFIQKPVQKQRPVPTAHLAQTMTLLSLTTIELRQKIESEIATNPALELVEERRCPTCRRILSGIMTCPVCSLPPHPNTDSPIVFVSPREDFRTFRDENADEAAEDSYLQAPNIEELPQFVLRQIAPELEPEERSIAAHILTSLNEDGLLTIPLVEIARYHHVPISQIEDVQHLIQRSDPLGVGSSSPQQALLVQLEVLGETRQVPVLAEAAIRVGLDLLSRRRYNELSHLIGTTTAHAREIAGFISDNLNPFPGRAYWGDYTSSRSGLRESRSAYHYPDVIISLLEDREDSPLVVEIAMPICGTLRVNPLFKAAIRQAPEEKVEQWQSSYEQASLLVKCLQQRNHTIVRLMTRLCNLQRQFILRGSAYIKPITRASLAQELDVHESTVSRAVSGKSVQLPIGRIIPMSMFFDRSLHIRTALKEIIDQEAKPLSDTEIGERLESLGFCIARRTVAKYRSMEGILPAHLRTPASQTLRKAV